MMTEYFTLTAMKTSHFTSIGNTCMEQTSFRLKTCTTKGNALFCKAPAQHESGSLKERLSLIILEIKTGEKSKAGSHSVSRCLVRGAK